MLDPIYIGGPMSGYPDFNRSAFNALAKKLRGLGYTVVNPVELEVPGATYDDQLAVDLAALGSCRSVALLNGWSYSNGSLIEVSRASGMGLTIYFPDAKWVPKETLRHRTKEGLKLTVTGMTRPVDDLGRVVVPKEIRVRYGWEPHDIIEIHTGDNGTVILKKQEDDCALCGSLTGLELHEKSGKLVCLSCRESMGK